MQRLKLPVAAGGCCAWRGPCCCMHARPSCCPAGKPLAANQAGMPPYGTHRGLSMPPPTELEWLRVASSSEDRLKSQSCKQRGRYELSKWQTEDTDGIVAHRATFAKSAINRESTRKSAP